MTRDSEYIEKFFEEKDLPYVMWELEHNEEEHIIDNEEVIKLIKEAPFQEQKAIADMLRQLDFLNQDINDYLKHLAIAYIKTNF